MRSPKRRASAAVTCGPLPPRPFSAIGWGGRIRTSVWRNQNPLPYHLATPQRVTGAKLSGKPRVGKKAGRRAPPRRPGGSERRACRFGSIVVCKQSKAGRAAAAHSRQQRARQPGEALKDRANLGQQSYRGFGEVVVAPHQQSGEPGGIAWHQREAYSIAKRAAPGCEHRGCRKWNSGIGKQDPSFRQRAGGFETLADTADPDRTSVQTGRHIGAELAPRSRSSSSPSDSRHRRLERPQRRGSVARSAANAGSDRQVLLKL